MKPFVRFDHVSKRYSLGEQRRSVRDLATDVGRRLRGQRAAESARVLWALRDFSFEVGPGEALGIIGPNGSGKTTTLKLLSRITYPTEGKVEVNGRSAALIELGAGFHPELSGRENIYLNGTILGLKRKEIDARFDEIVEFAGLERFIDTPVKRYSSGMYARLGFSVAVHVNPDVLLVDEVLAVGDMSFQNRCYDRMRQLRTGDRAIVFISHNLFAVRDLCTQAVFLSQGQVVAAGATDEVIQAYKNHAVIEQQTDGARPGAAVTMDQADDAPIRITRVQYLDANGEPADSFQFGQRMLVRIGYEAHQPVQDPTFSLVFIRADGTVCEGTSTVLCEQQPGLVQGSGYFEFVIDALTLTPNLYTLEVAISAKHVFIYDYFHGRESFRVETALPIHFPQFVAILSGEWRLTRNGSGAQVLGGWRGLGEASRDLLEKVPG